MPVTSTSVPSTAACGRRRTRGAPGTPYVYRTRDDGKSWTRIDTGIPRNAFVNVVREDPVSRGLLYAGTERGMFVSFDDGSQWQSFQQNTLGTGVITLGR